MFLLNWEPVRMLLHHLDPMVVIMPTQARGQNYPRASHKEDAKDL